MLTSETIVVSPVIDVAEVLVDCSDDVVRGGTSKPGGGTMTLQYGYTGRGPAGKKASLHALPTTSKLSGQTPRGGHAKNGCSSRFRILCTRGPQLRKFCSTPCTAAAETFNLQSVSAEPKRLDPCHNSAKAAAAGTDVKLTKQ
mmetsp:Transcript_57805/g.161318  ORF Transcript_57805/g.161318 Transcript_57805/m.161318 type:complete len:143 (+) Transcript_57805:183-611(+)